MLEVISSFPKQLMESFSFDYPKVKPARNIFVSGMGGSAIAGHILKNLSYIYPIRVDVISSYDLPRYIPEDSLFFMVSYSGNTEETLSVLEKTSRFTDNVVCITTGGKLEKFARNKGFPVINIPKGFPPRGALGYMLSAILLTLENNGILEISSELKDAILILEDAVKELSKTDTLAFELANKFYRRVPVIYSTYEMYAVAYRWQTQINENSKSFAHFHVLPEMNHNEISGLLHPKEIVEKAWIVFLTHSYMNDRMHKRIDITSEILRQYVMGMDIVRAKGETFLQQMLYLILLGDFVSYYLAIFYNEDPVSIPRIDLLKEKLS